MKLGRSLRRAAFRVAQSPDGRLVVAALRDGTVRWYRASDGVELLALFLHADGKRWVAFTPSGYYAAGPGGEDLVGWQVDNGPDRAADFFPASRFRDRFYRPEVVSLVLKTLDETEAVRQAEAATAQHEAPTPEAPGRAAVAQPEPPKPDAAEQTGATQPEAPKPRSAEQAAAAQPEAPKPVPGAQRSRRRSLSRRRRARFRTQRSRSERPRLTSRRWRPSHPRAHAASQDATKENASSDPGWSAYAAGCFIDAIRIWRPLAEQGDARAVRARAPLEP